MKDSPLVDVISAQKHGDPRGITSICSANPSVLDAAFAQARANDSPLLIESTCNQVNQYGGYTGQTPHTFMKALRQMAEKHQFPAHHLVVGGDHLGPNPWQNETAEQAMDKSRVLVRDYVRAGYTKIHLDTSMGCADDPPGPLSTDVVANRSADLAVVAEEALRASRRTDNPLLYVIGTEVPVPGGIEEDEELQVTTVTSVQETIQATYDAFKFRGLDEAWQRVIAVVVQPGVEYGNDSLIAYDQRAAAHLSHFIANIEGLVFEAHSTDYQTQEALKQLVVDQFAILKVGPALTFAYRQAIFALALIEEAWLSGRREIVPSNIRAVLDHVMLSNPVHWKAYYLGDEQQQGVARQFSFSDRNRYYWPESDVQKALAQLLANLSNEPIPLSLLSQFMPQQYQAIRDDRLANKPVQLIEYGITAVLDVYAHACGLLS